MGKDRYYLGSEEIILDSDQSGKLVQRLREYLSLRNVALLIGNGASVPLKAPNIGNVRSIVNELEVEPYALKDSSDQTDALSMLDVLLPDGKLLGVEPFLGTLYQLRALIQTLPHNTLSVNDVKIEAKSIQALERLIKKWLFLRCEPVGVTDGQNDLTSHKELLRRFLLRPVSLPRLKVFTTNYDLAIERALDEIGVWYFDGFVGTVSRALRSESYHYDLYFPGETTEGKVSRVDRVVQLYKLHGSLNWRRRTDGNGIDIIMDNKRPENDNYGEVMIYPSPLKVAEMHGYPYSEMLRQFAFHIHQPQSVLFTVGYSFRDDHINRIIYQALSIPSFVLIIVLPEILVPADPTSPNPEHEVWRLINQVATKESKRILVITGGEFDKGKFVRGAGTLEDFAKKWMPDIKELDIQAKVNEEVNKALKFDKSN